MVEVLGTDPETISEDSKFIDDLGADSLDVMQIIIGIEQNLILKLM